MHTHFDDEAPVSIAPPVYTPPVSYDAPPVASVYYEEPPVAPVYYEEPPMAPVYYEEPPVTSTKKAKPLYKLPETEVMPGATPAQRSTPPASDGDGPVVKFGNLKK